jgi:genome maintenance exonuclease 1
MKKNDRYNYVRVPRSDDEGNRTYDVKGRKLPSVTTILSRTKDQGFLKKWKAKVGDQQAEVIKNISSKRGTSMHKYIEAFILQKGYEDLTSLGQQAKTMAQKVIEKGLTPIEEYYGSEVTLFYPGLFAGTTDLVCRHNDMDTVVDFKQANQPKRKEWIDDYYMQIAAYAMAHDYLHGSKIEQGIIMVCTPDLYLQEFRFQGVELRDWKYKFLKRLSEYYEMIKEPSIDEKELLAQFEDSKIKEGK